MSDTARSLTKTLTFTAVTICVLIVLAPILFIPGLYVLGFSQHMIMRVSSPISHAVAQEDPNKIIELNPEKYFKASSKTDVFSLLEKNKYSLRNENAGATKVSKPNVYRFSRHVSRAGTMHYTLYLYIEFDENNQLKTISGSRTTSIM